MEPGLDKREPAERSAQSPSVAGGSDVPAQPLTAGPTRLEALTFDGTPLFPERRAHTVSYELSDPEAALYHFEKIQHRGAQLTVTRTLTDQELEDLEDTPEAEIEALEDEVVDQASASRAIEALEAEIATLKRLVGLAEGVLKSGEDTKWNKLAELLQDNPEMYDEHGRRCKLVLLTASSKSWVAH